jgi:hypothetical protein
MADVILTLGMKSQAIRESGETFGETVEFVETDVTLGRNSLDSTGQILITLSNGRTLRIIETGIADNADDLDNPNAAWAYVSWDELLEMLDSFRAERKN